MEFDDAAVAEVTDRLRKVEGQVAGIIKMIEAGRDCDDVITQLSAASRALDRAGLKLVASQLRRCIADPKAAAKEGYDEARLERMFLKLG